MMRLPAAILCLLLSTPALAGSPIVAMYGDSTTYGTTLVAGRYQQSANNEPASVQIGLPQATVENHGIPGITCSNLLWGQAPVSQPWQAEMAASAAAIVTVNVGINDAFLPTKAETDPDFIWCYERLAAIAQVYGKLFVIETPNPITDTSHDQRLWALVNDETWTAQHGHIFIIDQWGYILSNYPDWPHALPDGIHPNDSLYEFKAAVALRLLAPLVTLLANQ